MNLHTIMSTDVMIHYGLWAYASAILQQGWARGGCKVIIHSIYTLYLGVMNLRTLFIPPRKAQAHTSNNAQGKKKDGGMKSNTKRNYSVDKDIQRLGYVLPFFVVLLIIGPYVFVIPYIIIPQMSYSFSGISNMVIATSFVTLILVSYYKSIFTSPGYVPVGWKPDLESGLDTITHDSELTNMPPASRYCQKCNAHKPERAHHCRVCDKCILKMDHHCPWINNCVGHNNHKYFLLFLIYASLGIMYVLFLVVLTFIDAMQNSKGPEDFVAIFGLTILATIMLPLGLAIVMLLFWQLWLVADNTTSIENEEFERLRYTMKKEGKVYKHVNVYNLGTLTNLKMVFGPHIFWWWYPTRCHGDGISYKRDYRSSSVTKI
eukprot:Phypoly_transcript_09701.p1 GENE.Phypoly_transcript_09701~~Phypoly_transcript_09701.p1  ORF type:complete len:375 (+),score=7.71 Phypoly_transcript_09701:83-1207(+)